MLKAKAGLTGKPSKASLKSRGLHSNTHLRSWNEGTKTTSLDDGCYSLYSTDSEDVAGVNKGLDKCAELLTNILEIKGEKDAQKQYCQAILKNSKKEKYDPHSKCTSKKEKGGQRQKRKSRIHIHVPRKSSQNNMQSSKSKPAFNKRVVSSTPEPTVVQRQRQQELQYKESMLQQQIQILQEQYENLQKEENSQDRQNSNPQIHSEIPPQLLITNNEQVRDENSRDQRPRSARKSLEFPSNAEKPLIENLKEHAGSTITTSSPLNQNDGKLGEEMQKSTMKKVQFVNGQERNEKLSEISQSLDNHEPSSPCSSKSRHGHSTGLSTAGVGIQHGVKKQINQCKKDDLKQPSPHKNTDHLRILAYLVGQLKAVLGTTDVEVQRLMEIENEIRLLSYTAQYSPTHPVLANAGKQHDIDTEIALQPLRSENSDLRRKVRIANQRMREMESQCRKIPEQDQTRAPNEELVERLHHQLLKERESVEKFRHEVGLAEKRFQEYNKDKLNIQHILSDKEKDVNKLQEELKQQQGKAMTADTQAKLQFESIEITLNAKSKEVGLLNIALKQRDAEIERLTELTRGLQQSLTRVLSNVQELHPDDVISDVSIVSSVLDFHQPVGQRKIGPRVGIAMASSQFQPWDDDFYDQRKETHREEHNKMREYDIIKEEENGNSSLTDDSTDDVSLSPSSADEFVFKQELSNLDTVIARLQDSLRHKV